MNASVHRWAVGLAPVVIGILTVLVQGTTQRHIDPWVIGAAGTSGLLTAFINYLRAGTPQ